MSKLRFRDFQRLKSGRDCYSRMKYDSLVGTISELDRQQIAEQLPENENQAKVMRWMLRGLPLDKAVRKVKTDLEISANAADGARSRKYEYDYGVMDE